MKKITFIGITLFMSCFVSEKLVAQDMVLSKSPVSFGRYRDCTTGRGICGLDADNLNAKSSTTKFSIEKENDSTVGLKIFKSNISVADEVNLFGNAAVNFEKSEKIYFKMEVDLPLKKTSKTTLNLSGNYSKILNGIRPVIKFDSYYLIEFKLN